MLTRDGRSVTTVIPRSAATRDLGTEAGATSLPEIPRRCAPRDDTSAVCRAASFGSELVRVPHVEAVLTHLLVERGPVDIELGGGGLAVPGVALQCGFDDPAL